MSKLKTVLVVFVALAFGALVLADNAVPLPARRPGGLLRPEAVPAVAQEEVQRGTPGVTAPFIPFEEKDKIKFDDSVERAKKNDAKAFYWLSYYFAKGECVDRDADSARKFLEKAVDANDPVACYTFGLFLENSVLQNGDGRGVGDRETQRGFENLQFIRTSSRFRPVGYSAWNSPVSWNGNRCLTNKVAIAHVESFYQKAIDGGFSYATNDIARLHRKVDECERRIIQKKREQEIQEIDKKIRIVNAEKAKDLIHDPKETQAEERSDQQQEFWSEWPNAIPDDALKQLVSDVEGKFNCAFRQYHTAGFRPLLSPNSPQGKIEFPKNTWFRANGRSLIINQGNSTFQKIDSEGRIVAWGFYADRTDLEEFRYFETEKEKLLNSLRSEWAKERGMTLDEAIRKHDELCPPRPQRAFSRLLNRPRLNRPETPKRDSSQDPADTLARLRARRQALIAVQKSEAEKQRQAAEQAKEEHEREKKERELAAEERRAQLEQLIQIQEELRRQREEEEKLREQNNTK